jgi:hypothetical protein
MAGYRWLALRSRNPVLWFGRWLGQSDGLAASQYDPDRARPKLEFAVGLILLSVLLFWLMAIFR